MKRMQDSSILRQAKLRIASYRDDFICLAIDSLLYDKYLHSSAFSVEDKKEITEQCQTLQSWINTMLLAAIDDKSILEDDFIRRFPGTISYGTWIDFHHPELTKGMSQAERNEKLRQGRLNWLDWMIEECVKQENENARIKSETTTIGA